MKESTKTGLAFGLTSGVITTLGVIIGLDSGVGNKLVIIAGILTVAISDAFSDALGIHISQESSKRNNQKSVWEATLSTFFAKLLIALTFLIPILTIPLKSAVITNVIWGLLLITAFNFYLAKSKNEPPIQVIAEHLSITIIVMTITYYVGKIISVYF